MLFVRSPRKSCHVPMTGLRPRQTPNRHCWPASTASMALRAVSNRSEATRPTLVLSLTETQLWLGRSARLMRAEDEPMTNRISPDRIRAVRIAGALLGLAVVLGACTHTDEV